MPRGGSFRRAGAARAADVAQRTAIADQLLEQRAHEFPRAHVLGLFLQPDDVARATDSRRAPRAARRSGTAYSCSTRQIATSAGSLRGARCAIRSTYTLPLHSTSAIARSSRAARASSSSMTDWKRPCSSSIGVDATSGCRSRLFGVSTNSGSGSRRSSAACRRSRWKYCAAVVQFTSAQVDVGRRLEEALGACARVLGSLAFVAVRQQEHERRLQSPLRASRRHELVEDDLRAVDEVAVLRFPDDEALAAPGCCSRTRSRRRRALAERAVVDLERRARLRKRPAAG